MTSPVHRFSSLAGTPLAPLPLPLPLPTARGGSVQQPESPPAGSQKETGGPQGLATRQRTEAPGAASLQPRGRAPGGGPSAPGAQRSALPHSHGPAPSPGHGGNGGPVPVGTGHVPDAATQHAIAAQQQQMANQNALTQASVAAQMQMAHNEFQTENAKALAKAIKNLAKATADLIN